MEFKGSKTEQNLMTAFAGESQARNKYTYYAMKARAEGMEQIANIFEETARNEQEHAMLWFKALHGDQIPTTDVNLQEFAKIAREEGFNKIAAQMDMVAKIEKRHEERYLALLSNVKEDKVFKKEEDVMWKCQICGYTLVGKNAPGLCPLCGYAKSFFEVEKANY